MELDGRTAATHADDFATFRTDYAQMLRVASNDPLYKAVSGVLRLMQKNRGSAIFGIGFADHFPPSFPQTSRK